MIVKKAKRVTVVDVARACGVSPMLVSFALRNVAGEVNEETRQHILKTARKLGYSPSFTARGLRNGKSSLIALVVGRDVPENLKEVQGKLAVAGYDLMICTDKPGSLQRAVARNVEAFIWEPSKAPPDFGKVISLKNFEEEWPVFLRAGA
ncbi:MAG TPA: LacI family DNA-binding transcriptional regulator [Methylomirabilota bacterium]|nr:LacI family DNA-binding transcriptional regulator [Methylomirabilota bacterium]